MHLSSMGVGHYANGVKDQLARHDCQHQRSGLIEKAQYRGNKRVAWTHDVKELENTTHLIENGTDSRQTSRQSSSPSFSGRSWEHCLGS